MPETLTTPQAIALLATTLVLMWLLCFWLIGELGGWGSLAKSFATDREPTGEMFPWTSGKFNMFSSYNNCLTASPSADGIYIRPMLLFRFRHKPLFLPWDVIAVMRPRPEMFRYGTFLEVTTDAGVHPVTLYGRQLAQSLTNLAPDRLLGPRTGGV